MAQPILTGLNTFINPLNGKPIACGTVRTYTAGTTNQKTTYRDKDGLVANQWPTSLDNTGSCFLFGNGVYDIEVRDRCGNTVLSFSSVGWLDTDPADSELPDLKIGNQSETEFLPDNRVKVYESNDTKEEFGFVFPDQMYMLGSENAEGVAGSWASVLARYQQGGREIPEKQFLYGDVSGDRYNRTFAGSYTINPDEDTTIDYYGQGDNWINHDRRSVVYNGMKTSKIPMEWDSLMKEKGLITHPQLVLRNGVIYTTIENGDYSIDPTAANGGTAWKIYGFAPYKTIHGYYWHNDSDVDTINITGGVAIDRTGLYQMLFPGLTPSTYIARKQLNAAWSEIVNAGTKSGALGNGVTLTAATSYRLWVIGNPTTGKVDFGITTAADSAANSLIGAGAPAYNAGYRYGVQIDWVITKNGAAEVPTIRREGGNVVFLQPLDCGNCYGTGAGDYIGQSGGRQFVTRCPPDCIGEFAIASHVTGASNFTIYGLVGPGNVSMGSQPEYNFFNFLYYDTTVLIGSTYVKCKVDSSQNMRTWVRQLSSATPAATSAVPHLINQTFQPSLIGFVYNRGEN